MSVWRKTPFCGAIRRVFIFRKNLSELTELVEFARRERRGQLDVPVDFFGKVEKGRSDQDWRCQRTKPGRGDSSRAQKRGADCRAPANRKTRTRTNAASGYCSFFT